MWNDSEAAYGFLPFEIRFILYSILALDFIADRQGLVVSEQDDSLWIGSNNVLLDKTAKNHYFSFGPTWTTER